MTFVATLGIYGIASRKVITTSMRVAMNVSDDA